MKKTLEHLPKDKQDELALVVEAICKTINDIEMLILFGSYARGDWVEDIYTQGHTTYEYKSDFDILAVTTTEGVAHSPGLWHKARTAIAQQKLDTPVTIIAHDINYINSRLKRGHYFFTDIKKEGILLYSAGNFELAEEKQPDQKTRAGIAKADFKQWTGNARSSYQMYEQAIKIGDYKWAAFMLHQATEALYSAVVLVFRNYKPKNHNLEELGRMAANHNQEFITVFPKNTDEEKKCFDLLNRAYVEARYEKDYKITKEQLEYLAGRVKVLLELTERICKEKIESFV